MKAYVGAFGICGVATGALFDTFKTCDDIVKAFVGVFLAFDGTVQCGNITPMLQVSIFKISDGRTKLYAGGFLV